MPRSAAALAAAAACPAVAQHHHGHWTPYGPHGDACGDATRAGLYQAAIGKEDALVNGAHNATAPALSQCSSGGGTISCPYQSSQISGRWVGWQVPQGSAPSGGWPFAILYHGWYLFNSQYAWYSETWYTHGLYHKAGVIKALLDAGFGVITPDAHSGKAYWETNDNAYATADLSAWTRSPDHTLVEALLSGCSSGTFGPCDSSNLHAFGFSSGGYMTSRMAVNYAQHFRSLAVVGGSFYYCCGSCSESVANQLPSSVWRDHPPTLFLHGSRDSCVPTSTGEMYYNRLQREGVATKWATTNVGHEWPSSSPSEIVAWFQRYSISRNATAAV